MDLASEIRRNVRAALVEDVGSGDLTAPLVPSGTQVRAVVLCRRPQIDIEDLPEAIQFYTNPARTQGSRPLADLGLTDQPMPLTVALEIPERRIIEAALKRNNWNRQATAAELDINRTTLYKKMRKYRLDVGETN